MSAYVLQAGVARPDDGALQTFRANGGDAFDQSNTIVEKLSLPTKSESGNTQEKENIRLTIQHVLMATAQEGHPNMTAWFCLLDITNFQDHINGLGLSESIQGLKSLTDLQQQLVRAHMIDRLFPGELNRTTTTAKKLGRPGTNKLNELVRTVKNLSGFLNEKFPRS